MKFVSIDGRLIEVLLTRTAEAVAEEDARCADDEWNRRTRQMDAEQATSIRATRWRHEITHGTEATGTAASAKGEDGKGKGG